MFRLTACTGTPWRAHTAIGMPKPQPALPCLLMQVSSLQLTIDDWHASFYQCSCAHLLNGSQLVLLPRSLVSRGDEAGGFVGSSSSLVLGGYQLLCPLRLACQSLQPRPFAGPVLLGWGVPILRPVYDLQNRQMLGSVG